ncbi:MAG: threonine ammonia-lyase [Proteobacteria bacterium]|nr:threonine ammonia-lyase [Pseudomonadota bacterium]MBI3499884.1 threonine ammonia-lyase [Pseudomonadota bacterium]
MTLSLADVSAAEALLRGQVVRTPTVFASALSAELGIELWLKLETLQHAGSFKCRGAYVKLKSLAAAEARAGVIAMSAGNHAQGVAFFAGKLGIPATIVMPLATPFSKIERTRAFGARVELVGDSLSEAQSHAERLAAAHGLTFVHPYDDPKVMAGQGTIAIEMLADMPGLDALLVPIGGGGLISGIAVAAKALKPEIEVVGVQSELYPSMRQALAGEAIRCGGDTIAEGIAVKLPGKLTCEIVRRLVSDILLVDEQALEHAVQMLAERQKLVVEGAGAAGIAALALHGARFRGRRVGVVLCGGNVDARLLASVLMRGLVADGRLARLRVEISDAPGRLAAVALLIAEAGGNIVEIYHQRLFQDVPVKLAELDVVVETRNAEHVRDIAARLAAAGHTPRLLGTTKGAGEVL